MYKLKNSEDLNEKDVNAGRFGRDKSSTRGDRRCTGSYSGRNRQPKEAGKKEAAAAEL